MSLSFSEGGKGSWNRRGALPWKRVQEDLSKLSATPPAASPPPRPHRAPAPGQKPEAGGHSFVWGLGGQGAQKQPEPEDLSPQPRLPRSQRTQSTTRKATFRGRRGGERPFTWSPGQISGTLLPSARTATRERGGNPVSPRRDPQRRPGARSLARLLPSESSSSSSASCARTSGGNAATAAGEGSRPRSAIPALPATLRKTNEGAEGGTDWRGPTPRLQDPAPAAERRQRTHCRRRHEQGSREPGGPAPGPRTHRLRRRVKLRTPGLMAPSTGRFLKLRVQARGHDFSPEKWAHCVAVDPDVYLLRTREEGVLRGPRPCFFQFSAPNSVCFYLAPLFVSRANWHHPFIMTWTQAVLFTGASWSHLPGALCF